MGLNTCIYKMAKMDPSKTWTDAEIYSMLEGSSPDLMLIRPVLGSPDFHLDGADDYLFKCTCQMYDKAKMMAKLGIREEDGWIEDGSSSSAVYTPKSEQPPEDDVEWWFSFVNRHGSDDYKNWEYREIPAVISSDELVTNEDYWCIVTIDDAIADLRKGENTKFHDDGLWDDNWCPVCSKKILKEHMEKYFDDGPGYYDNCREAFKEIIFNKFEDDKGLCVVYV